MQFRSPAKMDELWVFFSVFFPNIVKVSTFYLQSCLKFFLLITLLYYFFINIYRINDKNFILLGLILLTCSWHILILVAYSALILVILVACADL